MYDNLDFKLQLFKKQQLKEHTDEMKQLTFIFREDCVECCEKSAKERQHICFGIVIYIFVFDTEKTQINLLFVYFLFKLNKKRR